MKNLKLLEQGEVPNLKQVYLEKYNLYLLTHCEKENEDEEDRNEIENGLESLLEQDGEEIIQEQPKEYLESILDKEKTSNYEKLKYELKFQKYLTFIKPYITHSEIDFMSGATIYYVPGSYFPGDVVGMYVPKTNTIYISTDQSPREIRVTKHHEIYHARYGSDEREAEAYGQRMAA